MSVMSLNGPIIKKKTERTKLKNFQIFFFSSYCEKTLRQIYWNLQLSETFDTSHVSVICIWLKEMKKNTLSLLSEHI